MSMLNKFLGRKEGSGGSGGSPSSPSQRGVDGRQQQQQQQRNQQDDNVSIVSQGFLCPICYRSFDNSDLLSSHFANEHDTTTESHDNVTTSATSKSPNSSAVDSILKKYTTSASASPPQSATTVSSSDTESLVDTKSVSSFNELAQIFTSTFSSSGGATSTREQQLEKELFSTREKLHTAEEIKTILSNDIKDLQERVDRLGSDNKKLGSYKINSDEKLKSALEQISKSKSDREQLTSENESLKTHLAQLQEEFVKNADQISSLEKQLAIRPTQDDLNLLKKELVQVQQLTDTILKEKENEHKQLMREQKELTLRLEQKDKELAEIGDKVESLKELEELRERVKSLEEKNSEAEKIKNELESELSVKEKKIESQVKELSDYKSTNAELEREVKLKMSQINEYLVEIKELSQEKSQLNQNIAELEMRKAELSRIVHDTKVKSDDESSATIQDDENESSTNKSSTELDTLLKEKEDLENELIKLRTKNQSMSEEKASWLIEKNEFLGKLEQLGQEAQELGNKIKSLEEIKLNLETDKASLEKKTDELEKARQSATDMSQSLTAQYEQEKQRVAEEHSQKISQATDSIARLESEKQAVEKQKANLSNEIESLNQLNEENRRLIAQLNGKLDETQQTLNDLSTELVKSKQEMESLSRQLAEKSSELEQTRLDGETRCNELQEKLDEQTTQKEELSKKLNELVLAHDELKQVESELQNQLASAKIALENANMLNDDLSNKLEKANSEKEEQGARVISLEEEKTSLEAKLLKADQSLGETRQELETARLELATLQAKYDTDTGGMSKELESVNKRVARLTELNEELTIERDDCEKMRVDVVKKHEVQLKALQQNLASLRMESRTQSDKLASVQSELTTIKGSNLELEAKLSNCSDERNQLLERCVTAERLCETYKTQNIELKRRVEESESALHELAREHQSLQVQNNKRLSSKWVDDSHVDECLQCKKQFSVIIRKHHCRNCGQVFCNECSSHSAQISASRNPQRVCKACFIELTQ